MTRTEIIKYQLGLIALDYERFDIENDFPEQHAIYERQRGRLLDELKKLSK